MKKRTLGAASALTDDLFFFFDRVADDLFLREARATPTILFFRGARATVINQGHSRDSGRLIF
jgi:hypothetical protein